ncbi:MAG: FHA domain-containing protein [Fibrobacteria bacterium]|nr:FHA domain-containing protein [Fibrobacteria bacterium]
MSFCITSKNHTFPLKSGMNIVGRSKKCDICIPVPSISKTHLSIDVVSDNSFTLMDLGSSNGLYIQGVQVSNAILQLGDFFAIGPITFQIKDSIS